MSLRKLHISRNLTWADVAWPLEKETCIPIVVLVKHSEGFLCFFWGLVSGVEILGNEIVSLAVSFECCVDGTGESLQGEQLAIVINNMKDRLNLPLLHAQNQHSIQDQ